MPLSAIFFDLDHTLIHSLTSDSGEPRAHAAPDAMHGSWSLWQRPCAQRLLGIARKTRRPVYLCTLADPRYAHGTSAALGLGFDAGDILAIEHLRFGKQGISPRSVLVDDRPPSYEGILVKRSLLGISAERVFHVPAYEGHDCGNEHVLVHRWRMFLQAHLMSAS